MQLVTVGFTHGAETPARRAAHCKTRPEFSAGVTAIRTMACDGVGVTDVTPEVRDRLDIPSRVQGAIVTQIDPTSPAAQQGLREGDVILELDRKLVKNADDAVNLSEQIKGPTVMVRVWREGQSRFMVIDESTG